ncbi:MAG: hypothetical protein ABF461_08655 [Zymomonas mobilis subsp. pomaceae]
MDNQLAAHNPVQKMTVIFADRDQRPRSGGSSSTKLKSSFVKNIVKF